MTVGYEPTTTNLEIASATLLLPNRDAAAGPRRWIRTFLVYVVTEHQDEDRENDMEECWQALRKPRVVRKERQAREQAETHEREVDAAQCETSSVFPRAGGNCVCSYPPKHAR